MAALSLSLSSHLPKLLSALSTFTFSGANKITLSDGTYYVVVVEYSGGDTSNNVIVGLDNSSPSHSGNTVAYSSSWNYYSRDTIFYVYKDA